MSAHRICRCALKTVDLFDGYEADTEWDYIDDSDESEEDDFFDEEQDYLEFSDQHCHMDICDSYVEENENPITFSPEVWSF